MASSKAEKGLLIAMILSWTITSSLFLAYHFVCSYVIRGNWNGLEFSQTTIALIVYLAVTAFQGFVYFMGREERIKGITLGIGAIVKVLLCAAIMLFMLDVMNMGVPDARGPVLILSYVFVLVSGVMEGLLGFFRCRDGRKGFSV